jgi:3-hydroxyisobutyrate dehydrogenase-like beta-hydroxyacid dehydrogenase
MTSRPAHNDAVISVIGLGLMGTPLTLRLRDHGWRVHIWNRTRSRAQPLLSCRTLRQCRPHQARE